MRLFSVRVFFKRVEAVLCALGFLGKALARAKQDSPPPGPHRKPRSRITVRLKDMRLSALERGQTIRLRTPGSTTRLRLA